MSILFCAWSQLNGKPTLDLCVECWRCYSHWKLFFLCCLTLPEKCFHWWVASSHVCSSSSGFHMNEMLSSCDHVCRSFIASLARLPAQRKTLNSTATSQSGEVWIPAHAFVSSGPTFLPANGESHEKIRMGPLVLPLCLKEMTYLSFLPTSWGKWCLLADQLDKVLLVVS